MRKQLDELLQQEARYKSIETAQVDLEQENARLKEELFRMKSEYDAALEDVNLRYEDAKLQADRMEDQLNIKGIHFNNLII